VCTAGTLTLTVVGSVTFADLRVTNDGVGLPAYQRVNTSTDYDTTGFPYYLRFDGTDDSLATATFTPGTDKLQAFTGVRKLSDAAFSCLYEFSAAAFSNSGTFNSLISFNGAASAGPYYGASSRGSGSLQVATSAATFPAPQTAVQTQTSDIAGDSVVLRINGVQAATATSDQGAGNYLAYPLYIGRRGGTTLPFNGRIYSLIIRFGANLDAATITNTETWVNGKTMAY
jgi:hypothetical protein